jgi:hypothetical protein
LDSKGKMPATPPLPIVNQPEFPHGLLEFCTAYSTKKVNRNPSHKACQVQCPSGYRIDLYLLSSQSIAKAIPAARTAGVKINQPTP